MRNCHFQLTLVRNEHIRFKGLVSLIIREYPAKMESSSSIKKDILSAFQHYSSFISCKFVIDAIIYCVTGLWKIFSSAVMEKGIKYSQDLSTIITVRA